MITYNGGPTCVTVRLDSRVVGEIRMSLNPRGFQYFPKGKNDISGDVFSSLAACKRSLEAPEPDTDFETRLRG